MRDRERVRDRMRGRVRDRMSKGGDLYKRGWGLIKSSVDPLPPQYICLQVGLCSRDISNIIISQLHDLLCGKCRP